MKEIIRERDITRVRIYQAVLENHDIPTMIQNEHLTVSGLSEIPIPEFFPALSVNDDDYDEAMTIIRDYMSTSNKESESEIVCASCGEKNPGNFEICWSCGNAVAGEKEVEQDCGG